MTYPISKRTLITSVAVIGPLFVSIVVVSTRIRVKESYPRPIAHAASPTSDQVTDDLLNALQQDAAAVDTLDQDITNLDAVEKQGASAADYTPTPTPPLPGRVASPNQTSRPTGTVTHGSPAGLTTNPSAPADKPDQLQSVSVVTGTTLTYSLDNGTVTIRGETSTGEDVAEADVLQLTESLAAQTPKIVSDTSQILVSEGSVAASAHVPIQVSVLSHQVFATTSTGSQQVRVLPDEAVTQLLADRTLNTVTSEQYSGPAQAKTGPVNLIGLVEKDGLACYRITGQQTHHVFHLIPVQTNVTLFVSVDTIAVIAKEQSLLARLIQNLSTD